MKNSTEALPTQLENLESFLNDIPLVDEAARKMLIQLLVNPKTMIAEGELSGLHLYIKTLMIRI